MANPKLVINPATRKAANKKRRPRRKTRKNTAIAKVTAPRTVSNKRRKRAKHRNGVTALKAVPNKRHKRRSHKHRNGLLGNSRASIEAVGGVMAGLVGAKTLNGSVGQFTNGLLSNVGMGAYATPINEFFLALMFGFVGDFIGKKMGVADLGKNARLGGFAAAGIDLVNAVAPTQSPFAIFNNNNIPVLALNRAAAAGAAAALSTASTSGIPEAARRMGLKPNNGMPVNRGMIRPSVVNLNRAMS